MKQNIIIAGSSGSIGGEFTKQYTDDPNVEKVVTLSRNVNNLNHEKIQSIKIREFTWHYNGKRSKISSQNKDDKIWTEFLNENKDQSYQN